MPQLGASILGVGSVGRTGIAGLSSNISFLVIVGPFFLLYIPPFDCYL